MRNPLSPVETVQRLLLSSPAKIVGEFSDEGLLIAHAWPTSPRQVHTQMYGEGTVFARSYLVASFQTLALPPPENENPRLLPKYGYIGDLLSILLAVLFGKRFENHGFLESHGMFELPDLGSQPPILGRSLPFISDQPRADLAIPLNLVELSRLGPFLVDESIDARGVEIFVTAGRFYLRSLKTFGDEPDLAYLDLVSCGEVLAGYYEYADAQVYTPELLKLFEEIRATCEHGEKSARLLKGHLRQIKQRYVRTLLTLLQSSFFDATEALEDWCRLRRDKIEARLKAAYDIRSKYLHAGTAFARHMHLLKCMNEVQAGRPVVGDQEWEEVLALAPTFVGLERITRYALLRFVHRHACRVDCRLDGPGL